MHWDDEGIMLAGRRHGEGGLVLQAFTRDHGRHGGLVRGGAGRKARSTFQLGNRLQLSWRARLTEQLGNFTAELIQPVAALVLDYPRRLTALRSACALFDGALPERDPHPMLYNQLSAFIDVLTKDPTWSDGYVRLELALLAELGFGLDLTACAVTGRVDNLIYVSPRTGRAVSQEGAGDYAEKLLPLPPFLIDQAPANAGDIVAGLRLTGFFLERHLFAALNRPLPDARQQLSDRLERDLSSSKA